MTDAAAASETVFVALESMLKSSGKYAAVNRHEVKNAPPSQLTAELWSDRIEPEPDTSGLAATSMLVTFKVRIRKGMLSQPEDAIDPAVLGAVIDLFTRVYGNFTFGVAGVEVDLHRRVSNGMFGQAGYVPQDGKLYRVQDVSIPVVMTDCFTQTR